MIDPRFQEIGELLDAAMVAQVAGDDQAVLEANYRIREIAWSISSEILLSRWERRHRVAVSRRVPSPSPKRVTVDDLLL